MSQPAAYIPPPPPELPESPPPPFAFRMPVLLLFIGYWMALTFGTHIPRLPRVVDVNFFDKVLHFVAYAGLAFGACLAWRMQRPRYASLSWRHYGVILLVFTGYGAIDELTQPYVGRSCELADWIADTAGVLFGMTLFVMSNGVRRWWVNSSRNAGRMAYSATR